MGSWGDGVLMEGKSKAVGGNPSKIARLSTQLLGATSRCPVLVAAAGAVAVAGALFTLSPRQRALLWQIRQRDYTVGNLGRTCRRRAAVRQRDVSDGRARLTGKDASVRGQWGEAGWFCESYTLS